MLLLICYYSGQRLYSRRRVALLLLAGHAIERLGQLRVPGAVTTFWVLSVNLTSRAANAKELGVGTICDAPAWVFVMRRRTVHERPLACIELMLGA